MNKNELFFLERAKTILECAKILKGINYTNGRVKKEIIDYCFKTYNLDIISTIKNNNKHYCLNCGKEISCRNKFCNSSCAAKYNNSKRVFNEETKKKISKSLTEHFEKTGKKKESLKKHTFICKTCGKKFFSKKLNVKFCSCKCAQNNEETKEKKRKKIIERINDGKFSGWKSRNIKSYAEKFWEQVLKNNEILFVREDHSNKRYFLDFLIEKNGKKIDLEIDGKQHKTRKEHDIKRDEFLVKNGYIVYRVEWNSINTKAGKDKMKEKIKEFLKFYEEQ